MKDIDVAGRNTAAANSTIDVWSGAVRLFHWSLAGSFAVAWISAEEWDTLHNWAGYAAAALVAFRLLYGILGPPHARFARFVRSPATLFSYLADMVRGHERRYIGHNPAGGAMIVALLVSMAGLCLTGWMQTLDAYNSAAWVLGAHEILANLLLVLVGLHILGVIVTSLRHRENLLRAMITGRKRAPRHGDVV